MPEGARLNALSWGRVVGAMTGACKLRSDLRGRRRAGEQIILLSIRNQPDLPNSTISKCDEKCNAKTYFEQLLGAFCFPISVIPLPMGAFIGLTCPGRS